MKQILVSEWFNGPHGCAGIVVMQNEIGERKAYFGMGWGEDQGADEQRIASFGTPVMAVQLKSILTHLEALQVAAEAAAAYDQDVTRDVGYADGLAMSADYLAARCKGSRVDGQEGKQEQ